MANPSNVDGSQAGAPRAVGKVLHDLRTPLTVISGTMKIMARHWERLAEDERAELMNRATAAAKTLDQNLESLREFAASRPDRGRLAEVSLVEGDDDWQASVMLRFGEAELSGAATLREDSETAAPKAVAEAVLRAVADLVYSPVSVRDVRVIDMGGVSSVLVTLNRPGPPLVGSAIVEGLDTYSAVARATLDALNRVFLDRATLNAS